MYTNEDRERNYREHLKTITNGLQEMRKAAGREDPGDNNLLRECYNLVGVELDTAEGWAKRGGTIRKGQHAYLFWDNQPDRMQDDGFGGVVFLFAREQMDFSNDVQLYTREEFETECKKNADAIALAYENKLQEYRSELAQMRTDLRKANKKLEKILSTINEEE